MKSIKYKLVIALSIFVSLILIGIFLFQNMYFSHFYFKEKISKTERNINEFIDVYLSEKWTERELNLRIDKFNNDNNALGTVKNAEEKESVSPDDNNILLSGVDEQNNKLNILVDKKLLDEELMGEIPKVNEEYHIEGFYLHENSDYIIAEDIESQYDDFEDGDKDQIKSSKKFEGRVKVLEVTEKTTIGNNDEINEKKYISPDLYYYENYNPFLNNRYVTFVKNFNAGNGEKIFNVQVNLQSLEEPMIVLSDYYKYIFIIVIVLVIIFSIIFSSWITSPIIRMSKVANNMANMNFEEKVSYKSKDEIGSLAENLNLLSDNLNTTIIKLNSANEKLKGDIEKEKQRERERKEFVANVSHELKTPLGIIKSYSEAIRDGFRKQNHPHYLDVIIKEVDQMNKLVLSMLELSSIEDMSRKLRLTPVNMKELIQNQVNYLNMSVSKKFVSFDIKGDFVEVLADQNKIHQVILNILSNAVKYCNEYSVIQVSSEIKEEKCLFKFTNKCSPLSKEELKNIWNRFYKGDKSHNRAVGGTGLGLAIVKHVVINFNGNIDVKSEVGKGTEFIITLPIEPETSYE